MGGGCRSDKGYERRCDLLLHIDLPEPMPDNRLISALTQSLLALLIDQRIVEPFGDRCLTPAGTTRCDPDLSARNRVSLVR